MATNLNPDQTPGFGGGDAEVFPSTAAFSGTSQPDIDPTNELGQTAPSLFGVAIPAGTGAPGGQGATYSADVDPSNEPGQTVEGFSGEGPDVIADTGAPGTTGAVNHGAGPDAVKYTRPGSFLSGTNVQDTVNDSISGTDDWTQAIDGSYGAAPNLPGIQGNQPLGTGAGMGRVMRGGRSEG